MTISKKEKDEIMSLIIKHHKTMSATQLSKYINVSRTTLRRICRELGVTCNATQPNQIDDARIVTYIKEHWNEKPISKIAAYLDVSETYVNDKARRLGLHTKSELVRQRQHDPMIFVALNREAMTQTAMAKALNIHKSEIKRLSVSVNQKGAVSLASLADDTWRQRMKERYETQWSEDEIARYLYCNID